MAMESLGRLINVAPIIAGSSGSGSSAISLKECSGITFVCTGNDTFTLTVAPTFSGSYVTPPTTTIGGGMIRNYYTNTATNGTAKWVKTKLSSGSYVNSVTISSGTVVFTVYPIDLAGDPSGTNYAYVKLTASASGLAMAVTHDLTVQRAPANLPALSA